MCACICMLGHGPLCPLLYVCTCFQIPILELPVGCIAFELINNKLTCRIFRKYWCTQDPEIKLDVVVGVKMLETRRENCSSEYGEQYTIIYRAVAITHYEDDGTVSVHTCHELRSFVSFNYSDGGRGKEAWSDPEPDLQKHEFIEAVQPLVQRALQSRSIAPAISLSEVVVPSTQVMDRLDSVDCHSYLPVNGEAEE